MKCMHEIESELLEDEALRCQVEKALSGRKKLPRETVIEQQSEKWKGAWSGSVRKMEDVREESNMGESDGRVDGDGAVSRRVGSDIQGGR